MNKYLFNRNGIQLIVKAPGPFEAACYATQWWGKRYVGEFKTHDAIELENDMDFGVTVAITADSVEYYDSETLYFK